jgi:hypothetical protein
VLAEGAAEVTETSDDVAAEAERMARTLAAIMASRSSDARPGVGASPSWRIASKAAAVYFAFKN